MFVVKWNVCAINLNGKEISVCLKSLPSNCKINVAVDIVYTLKPVIVKWMKIMWYLKVIQQYDKN